MFLENANDSFWKMWCSFNMGETVMQRYGEAMKTKESIMCIFGVDYISKRIISKLNQFIDELNRTYYGELLRP